LAGFYGRPPVQIDAEIRRKIIGDEEPIKCRPADLLEPELGRIPEDVKPYVESEEDELTHALFPKVAVDFFRKREAKRREEAAVLTFEQQELEEVASLAVAVATFIKSTTKVTAVIPIRKSGDGRMSPWVFVARQEQLRHGG